MVTKANKSLKQFSEAVSEIGDSLVLEISEHLEEANTRFEEAVRFQAMKIGVTDAQVASVLADYGEFSSEIPYGLQNNLDMFYIAYQNVIGIEETRALELRYEKNLCAALQKGREEA